MFRYERSDSSDVGQAYPAAARGTDGDPVSAYIIVADSLASAEKSYLLIAGRGACSDVDVLQCFDSAESRISFCVYGVNEWCAAVG